MKAIRTRSIPNVDTDRLTQRLDDLRDLIPAARGWAEQKSMFKARVRETINIERELTRRGVPFEPVTDGRHLDIDVFAVPETRPTESHRLRMAAKGVDVT